MFDSQFNKFLHGFVKMYNSDIFNDTKKCKSLLLDHAKGEFAKEIRLLLQVLELDCHKEIFKTNNIGLTRMALIKKIQNEFFITEDISAFYIDLLLSVLRNYKTDIAEEEKKAEIIVQKITNSPPSQNISHDYEKEAKAERFYQTALKKFFMDITNNFTLAIDSLIKAIKLCPDDKRFHFYISYCFFKVNDTNSLNNEIRILRELGYDSNICNLVRNEITSSKQGHIAIRLHSAFIKGGEIQMAAAQERIYSQYKLSYVESGMLFKRYNNFFKWSEDFDKIISLNNK